MIHDNFANKKRQTCDNGLKETQQSQLGSVFPSGSVQSIGINLDMEHFEVQENVGKQSKSLLCSFSSVQMLIRQKVKSAYCCPTEKLQKKKKVKKKLLQSIQKD